MNQEQHDAAKTHFETLRGMVFDALHAITHRFFPAGGIVNPETGLSLFREGNILTLNRDRKSKTLKLIFRMTAPITYEEGQDLSLGCCGLLEMDTRATAMPDPKTLLIVMDKTPEKIAACWAAADVMKSKHRPAGEELYRVQAAFWAWQTITQNGSITLPGETEVLVKVTEKENTTDLGNGNKIVKIPKGSEMVILGGEFKVRSVSRSEMTLQAKPGTTIDPTL